MKSVVAFYRARPLVGILVFVVGLAIAIGTTALKDDDGIVLPIFFCAVMGLVVGSVVALGQRGRRAEGEGPALDPTDPRDAP